MTICSDRQWRKPSYRQEYCGLTIMTNGPFKPNKGVFDAVVSA